MVHFKQEFYGNVWLSVYIGTFSYFDYVTNFTHIFESLSCIITFVQHDHDIHKGVRRHTFCL